MAEFISKRCKNLVMCMIPNDSYMENGRVKKIIGKHIEFHQGEFSTSDTKTINFIRNHELFNREIFEVKIDE